MKSQISALKDPYTLDPVFVDHNLVGESSFKDDLQGLNGIDYLMDLANYNDNQLEEIIFNGGPICDPHDDFDNFLNDIQFVNNDDEILSSTSAGSTPTQTEYSFAYTLPTIYEEEGKEVVDNEQNASLDDLESVNSDTSSQFESADTISNCSFKTGSSSGTSSLKRKSSYEEDPDFVAPKRRKAVRRNRRVMDERVKNQNKVAAMKYRKKKREEKTSMDDILEEEQLKHDKLQSQYDELSVNVAILKELLSKHLSQAQMTMK